MFVPINNIFTYMNSQAYIDNWSTQTKKCILPIIILSLLSQKRYYGYLLTLLIRDRLGIELSEGTIYPLLTKLHKYHYISYEWVEQEVGVPRKYYKITPEGIQTLELLKGNWNKVMNEIDLHINPN